MRKLRLVVLLTFLTGALHAQSPTVASVFRAGANGLGLNPYGSTSVSYSGGGAFVGTPAAASSGAGKVFSIALADAGSLGATTYQNGSWTGWNYASGGYGTANVPAITVAPSGIAYVVIRDGAGSAYWLNSVSSAGTWSTWIGLGGIFSTDPSIAAAADGSIWIVGRAGSSPPDATCPAGGCGAIWVARYVPGGAATLVSIQGTVRGKPHVTIGTDNAAYITARDGWNAAWVARVTGTGASLTAQWIFAEGTFADDLKAVSLTRGQTSSLMQQPAM